MFVCFFAASILSGISMEINVFQKTLRIEIFTISYLSKIDESSSTLLDIYFTGYFI